LGSFVGVVMCVGLVGGLYSTIYYSFGLDAMSKSIAQQSSNIAAASIRVG